MNEKLDIVTLGEGLIELSCNKSLAFAETFDKYYGGDTICTAIAAQKLGSKVGYISRVGNDNFQEFLLDNWQAAGLDISHVKLVNGSNGVYFIGRPVNDKKEFAYYRKKTAAGNISIDDVSEDYIKSAKIFYSTGIAQSISLSAREAVKKAYVVAKENDLLTAYDPNYVESIWSKEDAKEAFDEIIDYLDVLFLSLKKDALKLFQIPSFERLIKLFWDKGISTIVIKSEDDRGYHVGVSGEIYFVDFFVDRVIDTTCTGDAFNGGFLHALAKGDSPLEAAKLASIVAGLQSQKLGAIKSIPDKDTVFSYYERING